MTEQNLSLRKKYNTYNSKRLKNRSFSLIASNCNGGCILHDLGLPFNSPFVNLWMKPVDFIKFCKRMDYYLSQKMMFVTEDNISYPIGQLDDIRLYFQHYTDNKSAEEAWVRRSARINRDNLFILGTDRDGCTYDDIRAFDQLPFENKIIFCHKRYPEFKSAFFIPGFEKQKEVGLCMHFTNDKTYRKYYDAFDYVAWFNGKKHFLRRWF